MDGKCCEQCMNCDYVQQIKKHKLKDKQKVKPKIKMLCEADCHDCDYHWSKQKHVYQWNFDEEKHFQQCKYCFDILKGSEEE